MQFRIGNITIAKRIVITSYPADQNASSLISVQIDTFFFVIVQQIFTSSSTHCQVILVTAQDGKINNNDICCAFNKEKSIFV